MPTSVDRHGRDVNNAPAGKGGPDIMTVLPDTMIEIDPEERGGPEVLVPVERSTPRPGADAVLIRVAAAGGNRPAALQRQGAYTPTPGAPSDHRHGTTGGGDARGDGASGEAS